MTVSVCIRLRNNEDVFYSDRVVSGVVVVHASETTKAESLRVRAFGEGRTHLLMDDFCSATDARVYLDEIIVLWSKTKANGGVLTKGSHEFAFSFHLRDELPASIDRDTNNCCTVSYSIKACLSRRWKSNVKRSKRFTVVPYVDINEPDFTVPMMATASSSVSPVEMTSGVDRTGYCPGESILVSVKVENRSKTKIHGIVAELVASANVNAESISGHVSWTVCSMKGAPVSAHAVECWDAMPLRVPRTTPTFRCDLVEVRYFIRVRVKHLETIFPVFVGSVPRDASIVIADKLPRYIDNSDGVPCHSRSIEDLCCLTPPPGEQSRLIPPDGFLMTNQEPSYT